jgi:hypothetical protein
MCWTCCLFPHRHCWYLRKVYIHTFKFLGNSKKSSHHVFYIAAFCCILVYKIYLPFASSAVDVIFYYDIIFNISLSITLQVLSTDCTGTMNKYKGEI